MPRKKTTPQSIDELSSNAEFEYESVELETDSVEPVNKPEPKPKAKTPSKPEFAFEVALVHGGGEHMVKLNSRSTLDRFITNVTKRNLNAYPYVFTDDAGQTFILREFLFCRIVENH